jgi:carbohydrate-selective porin OprB
LTSPGEAITIQGSELANGFEISAVHMFYLGQVDWQPFAEIEDALMTIVRFGSWYTNSDTLAVDEQSVYEGNYGLYMTIDRSLLPESDDPTQGLATFCQFSWAPTDRNQVDQHFAAEFVYRGLLPNRDVDTIGLGVTKIEFCKDQRALTGQTNETAVELFYKARFGGRWAVEPDLPYIARPNGDGDDTRVVGVRFEAALSGSRRGRTPIRRSDG